MMRLLPEQTEREITFELTAAPGSQVFVAGTFNGWSPTANPMKDNPDSGHYKTRIRLPRGKHQYKFVVDGVWSLDPECPNWKLNPYGGLNSVLHL